MQLFGLVGAVDLDQVRAPFGERSARRLLKHQHGLPVLEHVERGHARMAAASEVSDDREAPDEASAFEVTQDLRQEQVTDERDAPSGWLEDTHRERAQVAIHPEV